MAASARSVASARRYRPESGRSSDEPFGPQETALLIRALAFRNHNWPASCP